MRRRDFIAGALALLLSVAGLSLAVPATATEVDTAPTLIEGVATETPGT